MHDVVIVGAGPSGLNCAHFLQKAGLDVVVLEKNEEIGPKVCAGGLTQKDMRYLKIPSNIIEYSYDKLKIMTPGRRFFLSFGRKALWTFDRVKLGKWQASRLKKGTVKTGEKVTEIHDGYVVAGRRYRFRHLVGADGSASIVRKYLGLDFKLGATIQYKIPTEVSWDIEIAFDYDIFSVWYIWLFPHKGYINIGGGCDQSRVSVTKLKNELQRWMDRRGIDCSDATVESFPITYNYLGHVFDNMFLVGDAAGLASGFTGEGIYQALVSGEEVARQIIDPYYEPVKLRKVLSKKMQLERLLWFWQRTRFLRPVMYSLIQACSKSKNLCRLGYRFACG